jgi:Phage Terminase
VKAGPKSAVDGSPLPLRGSRRRELAVSRFATDYVRVPRGHGARKPLRLRPWQRALIAATWDAKPRPRLAGWMLPRGQGKSSLTAVLALYELVAGAEGAQVVVVATDERQAGIVHRVASRMVELHPALESRVQQYADALTVPGRGSSFQVLPAVPKRLEGLDFTLAIVDEAGRVDQDVFEVVFSGHRQATVQCCAGHRDAEPGAGPDRAGPPPRLCAGAPRRSPRGLAGAQRRRVRGPPGGLRPLLGAGESGPRGLPGPGRAGRRAAAEDAGEQLPACPVVPAHRPARGSMVAPGAWAACADATRSIPDGAEVVVSFDGSFNGDTTVLTVASVDQRPHLDLVELWEAAGQQVPIVDVEAVIRAACRRWRVLEIAADPFRWARSLQLLDGEGLPVLEYPQSPGRMTPATARFYEAVVNGQLTHSGDSRLARHIGNAVLREDARGARLAKERRDSPRRIDAAVAAVMAHDRAAALAGAVQDSIYI